ncbi:hypothetical protein ABBQ32_010832 [Trebouxia sp. C0010 RCD-2024]
MSRGTRQNVSPAVEPDEEREPSSPAQPPAASVIELRQDLERFTFLQSIIHKGFMLEIEARDMYRQLTDSDDDDGYQDFVANINEPLTFLFLKLKRTIYHVRDDAQYSTSLSGTKAFLYCSLITNAAR